MYRALAVVLVSMALVAPAEANGSKKRVYRSAPPPARVIRVYEPRPAPPLAAASLLGTNLIVWDDLDVDLYDDGDPVPPRVLRLQRYPRAYYMRGW